ncbi:MAG: tRNA pseudouridine(54/55) synthase Pus10 [Haloglomus sp.]
MDVLAVARRAIASGPVCDACLGRLVADRSFGLRNEERGRALRTTIALADDEPYEAPETAECWVCEGLCGEFDALAEQVVDALEGIEFDTYQLGSRVPPLLEENEELLREEAGLDPVDGAHGEDLRKELNREVGRRVGARTGTEVDFERPQVQVTLDVAVGGETTVEVTINSLAVYGRYRKLERMVPQTEWPCSTCGGTGRQHGVGPCPECDGTGYRYRTSVEQEVAPTLVEAHRGREGVFHGAGREDVDALMLGTGRPFVLEVEAPHRQRTDLAELEREINRDSDAVEVVGLRYATHDMIERVKGLDATKTYRMAVEFDASVAEADLQAALDELQGATVEQRTPNRVDHRRADLVRTRTVHDISGSTTDDTHATLVVHGAGGLYVKELVSGDEGRTEPSLAGLLGVRAEVTALDVLAVEGVEEPFEDPDYFLAEDALDGAGGRDPGDWREGIPDDRASAIVTERASASGAIAPVDRTDDTEG